MRQTLAWAVWAALGLAFSAGLHAGPNLLQNGSFEDTVAPWTSGVGAKAEALRVSGAGAASGSGCLRFACSGQLAAVDYPELRLGRDFSRRGTYQVSAMLRNDGVRAGNFGLRLYFRDAAGEFLAMLGGLTVDTGTPVHGWTRYTTTFGRGTPSPLPPGAAALTVRFSFWSDDRKPVGIVWLDDVVLEAVGELPVQEPAAAAVALLWEDPSVAALAGPSPTGLAAVLEAAGYVARRVPTQELAAPGALDVVVTGALVLPYGEWYPAPLAPALGTFLSEGGLLLTWGPGALSRALYPSPHGWLPAGAAAPSGAATVALAFGEGWETTEAGPGDRLVLEPTDEGQAGEFHTPGLKGYAYRSTALPAVPADDLVVTFEARGDAATHRLCLELRERDSSRWKAVVPLTTAWTPHRLNAGEFVSYANGKLGRQDSVIRTRNLDRLLVGMTAAMAGPGRHRFELRGLRLEAAAVATATVSRTPAFAGPEREAARWFGTGIQLPARRPPMGYAPQAAQRWQCRRLVVPGGLPLPAVAGLVGRFAGLAVTGPEAVAATPLSPRGDLGSRLRAEQAVERLPLLRIERPFAAEGPDAAVLFLHRQGVLAGGRWLCVGIEAPDPAVHPGLAAALAASLRLARDAILCDGLRPRFRVSRDRVCLDVLLQARNPALRDVQFPLNVKVILGGEVRHDAPASVRLPGEAGAATECVLAEGIPVTGAEWLDLELRADPVSPAPPAVGRLRFRLAAEEALERIAEHLVREAEDDGRLHGFSFIDSRGMRALLAASDILGRKDFRRTAERWGEAMIRDQRPDGGYRMGYGITPKGEECYVADGGEIAVAIAHLAAYREGRQQEALLDSLDAYMAYREGFRVPGGGIGVGWCLQDYGQRPPVPLEAPTRVLAPEMNTYTIGCSLAAAYLQADLRRSPPLASRAAADADWLMGRTPRLHGAFVESFQYAHALDRDRIRRAVFGDYLGRAFSMPLMQAAQAARSWWFDAGGRSALDLGGLAYVLARLGDDPELRAEMMRATCMMFGTDSPESVLTAIRHRGIGHDGWIYICYGTLGLADVIQPLVSMEGPLPRGD